MKTVETLRRTLLVVALSYAQVGCDADRFFDVRNTQAFAEDSFSFEVAVVDQARFELAGINGRVEVVGVPGQASVKIEGIRRVESEDVADATANLDRLRVVLSQRSSYVRVHTDQPNNPGGRNFIVDYRITVPNDMAVEIDNVNGQIAVEGLDSVCDVQNINGQIRLVDIRGNATAAVVNGQIEAFLTLPEGGLADLRTVNGSIELEIPDNTSAMLEASVTNGTIGVSGFSMSEVVQTPRSFAALIGTGTSTIKLSTVNGSIRVRGSGF